jgi:hypothetical protein
MFTAFKIAFQTTDPPKEEALKINRPFKYFSLMIDTHNLEGEWSISHTSLPSSEAFCSLAMRTLNQP